MSSEQTQPFVVYLETLGEDRGALAALRRGLGQAPGTVPGMYRYVVPWLGNRPGRAREEAYYTIAALFAYHPSPRGVGNMGDHYRRARTPEDDNTALERRFTALLAAHPDDLPGHLRQAVSFLRSKEVPVNWHQLLADTMAWGHPDRYVQRRWAAAFWAPPIDSQDKEEK